MRNGWKRLGLAVVLTAASLAVPLCHAQTAGASGSWMGGRMDTNLYVGGHVGGAIYQGACNGVNGPCDDTDVGWKVLAGYQFHRNFAIEAAYFDFGKISATEVSGGVTVSADIKARGWEVVGVGILPLMQQFSVYAKLGVARTRVSGTATGSVPGFSVTQSATDHSTDLTFGVGAQYSFTRNIAARAEWQRYDSVGGDNVGKGDIDLFSAGLLLKF